jgi:diphthamide synthase (EF-2-diphthine--ammonia ligase)
MKVIALISGGKDSTFNMMECTKHGHQIGKQISKPFSNKLSSLTKNPYYSWN